MEKILAEFSQLEHPGERNGGWQTPHFIPGVIMHKCIYTPKKEHIASVGVAYFIPPNKKPAIFYEGVANTPQTQLSSPIDDF